MSAMAQSSSLHLVAVFGVPYRVFVCLLGGSSKACI